MKKFFLALFSFLLLSLLSVNSGAEASTTATLLPISDGAYTQFTPKSGASHFAMVDEAACNGNTDHNRTTVVGEKDSYGISLSSIPTNAFISRIDITPCASRNSAGGVDPVMNVFYRYNGVDSANAGAYSLTGTTPIDLATTSFTGLSKLKDGSTTLEVGAVLTSSTKGVKLSRMAVVITYAFLPPTVTTNAATFVSSSSATLNSTVNPNGFSTSAYFRYGTLNVGCASLASSASGTLIGSGTTNVAVNKSIDSLLASTTYYFCGVAFSSKGTSFGGVLSFTTQP